LTGLLDRPVTRARTTSRPWCQAWRGTRTCTGLT